MKNFEKLQRLLEELFQLDQADLDFGIYRIMNQKRDEVVRFLEKDLLPQVKEAFGQYKSADKVEVQKELDKAIEQAKALGVDPESSTKVRELREQYDDSAVDVVGLENEVFSHLFNFFRRYYHEGDFISLRRYKEGVYAIPYEGEEVKLHWANHDQYYIKSSEYLRDFAFKLSPSKRVRFKVVAGSTEQDNKKEASGSERRFLLCDEDPIVVEDGELIIRFEYRPDSRKRKQDVLNKEAAETLLANSGSPLPASVSGAVPTDPVPPRPASGRGAGGERLSSDFDWTHELAKLAPTKANANRSVLEKHLHHFTARNTFDYFIHKDLGGFLRRELDFYIKNEVMHLDDIEHDTVPRVEQYLSKIKVIRRIAHKIIQFVEQLENFQKKLWLKKKFVIETNYCVTLDRIPEDLYPEIAANEAQREEWVKLFAIDEIKDDLHDVGYSVPLTIEFLKANLGLTIDTALFLPDFTTRMLQSIAYMPELLDGVVVRSENFQALRLLSTTLDSKITATYIDPPYNTGDDGFPYKDSYQHSSWLAMLHDRLQAGRSLESPAATLTISIDDAELDHLCQVVRGIYGQQELAKLVWDRNRKNDAKYFSVGHEYMLVIARDSSHLRETGVKFREPKEGIVEAEAAYKKIVAEFGEDWEAVRRGWLKWFSGIPVSDPKRRLMRYARVGPRGPYRDDGNISWPGGGGPRYEVVHPTTGKPCKVPSRGWVYPKVERFWEEVESGKIVFGDDEKTSPRIASYLFESEGQVMPSVFYSYAQTVSQEFDPMFGSRVFDNPKNWRDLIRVFRYLAPAKDSWIMDYFAGSGTTAHSVIALNK